MNLCHRRMKCRMMKCPLLVGIQKKSTCKLFSGRCRQECQECGWRGMLVKQDTTVLDSQWDHQRLVLRGQHKESQKLCFSSRKGCTPENLWVRHYSIYPQTVMTANVLVKWNWLTPSHTGCLYTSSTGLDHSHYLHLSVIEHKIYAKSQVFISGESNVGVS